MEAPQSIEAAGTTIEDAIARGLEALNCHAQRSRYYRPDGRTGPHRARALDAQAESNRDRAAATAAPQAKPVNAEDAAIAQEALRKSAGSHEVSRCRLSNANRPT